MKQYSRSVDLNRAGKVIFALLVVVGGGCDALSLDGRQFPDERPWFIRLPEGESRLFPHPPGDWGECAMVLFSNGRTRCKEEGLVGEVFAPNLELWICRERSLGLPVDLEPGLYLEPPDATMETVPGSSTWAHLHSVDEEGFPFGTSTYASVEADLRRDGRKLKGSYRLGTATGSTAEAGEFVARRCRAEEQRILDSR